VDLTRVHPACRRETEIPISGPEQNWPRLPRPPRWTGFTPWNLLL